MMRTKLLVTLLTALALTGCRGGEATAESGAARAGGAPAAAEATTPRIRTLVALGASDVMGVGATRPDQDNWATVLAQLLPDRPTLVKLGTSGAVASELRKSQLAQAAAAKPDAVVLWTGVNDFNSRVPLDSFTADLAAMLAALRQTGARVYVVNLPALDELPAFQAGALMMRAALPNWRAAVAEQAAAHGAQLIELTAYNREIREHPEYLSGDGFHPSTVGYRRVAEIIAASVTR